MMQGSFRLVMMMVKPSLRRVKVLQKQRDEEEGKMVTTGVVKTKEALLLREWNQTYHKPQ
jgi:hypothetical protein